MTHINMHTYAPEPEDDVLGITHARMDKSWHHPNLHAHDFKIRWIAHAPELRARGERVYIQSEGLDSRLKEWLLGYASASARREDWLLRAAVGVTVFLGGAALTGAATVFIVGLIAWAFQWQPPMPSPETLEGTVALACLCVISSVYIGSGFRWLLGTGLGSAGRAAASIPALCAYRLEWLRMVCGGAERIYPSRLCNHSSQHAPSMGFHCLPASHRMSLAHKTQHLTAQDALSRFGGANKAMGYLHADMTFTLPVPWCVRRMDEVHGVWLLRGSEQPLRLDYSWEDVEDLARHERASWFRHRAACRAGLPLIPIVNFDHAAYKESWRRRIGCPELAPPGSLSLPDEDTGLIGALSAADEDGFGGALSLATPDADAAHAQGGPR